MNYLKEKTLRPCYITGSTNFKTLSKNDRNNLHLKQQICPDSGIIMLNPCPTPEAYSKFYREDYRSFYPGQTHPSEEYILKTGPISRLGRTAALLERILVNKLPHNILDLGSSEGILLNLLSKLFPKSSCFGIEPNKQYIEYSFTRNSSIDITHGLIEDQLPNFSNIDLITCCHVLEHIYDPKLLLTLVHSSLSKNGHLYIEVPNIENSIYVKNQTHIGHIHYFYPRILIALLTHTGFTTTHLWTNFHTVNAFSILARKSTPQDFTPQSPTFKKSTILLNYLKNYIC